VVRREDQDDLLAGREPAARSPAASAQLAAAGLDRLLPAGGVPPGLRVPTRRCLASGLRMAAAQAPQDQLEGTPPPVLPGRLVACRRREEAVQPGCGADDPLSLPGGGDPPPPAEPGMRKPRAINGACGEPGAQ